MTWGVRGPARRRGRLRGSQEARRAPRCVHGERAPPRRRVALGPVGVAVFRKNLFDRPGAKVRTRVSNQVWRVLRVFSDGRVQLRSGMAKAVVKASDLTGEEKFAVYV